ncbi:MAG: CoA pyrophosphatase [Asgard group archaeon]|nr:CoA pyrophosphatase [Asgard group archaeon]
MNILEKIRNTVDPLDAPIEPIKNLKLAAVLIPIFSESERILFTLRTQIVRHHQGQISFPGGRFDEEDMNLQTTALRETLEEVGISSDKINLIGSLNPSITISNYYVLPFVGLVEENSKIRINNLEVEHYFLAPITELIKPENNVMGDFEGLNLPYYRYKSYKIWGVTGGILTDLFRRLRS